MTTEQKTKSVIIQTSKEIAKEVAGNLKMEFENEALDIIAELVYKKLLLYGSDLDAFQRHANRSSITVDDVKLLVRRNDSLRELVDAKIQSINSSKPPESVGGNKRKRKATV